MVLENHDYNERDIENFFAEVIDEMNFTTDEEALNKFDILDNNIKQIVKDNIVDQIIFEGIAIPKKYNMLKISEVFDLSGLVTDDEKAKLRNRILGAFELNHNGARYRDKPIIYIKDLYGKSIRNIMSLRNMGITSYNFFIQVLKQIAEQ